MIWHDTKSQLNLYSAPSEHFILKLQKGRVYDDAACVLMISGFKAGVPDSQWLLAGSALFLSTLMPAWRLRVSH